MTDRYKFPKVHENPKKKKQMNQMKPNSQNSVKEHTALVRQIFITENDFACDGSNDERRFRSFE